jgi:hypothetical protein
MTDCNEHTKQNDEFVGSPYDDSMKEISNRNTVLKKGKIQEKESEMKMIGTE